MFEFKSSWSTHWGQDDIGKIRKKLVFRISYPTGITWTCLEKASRSTMGVGVSKDKDEKRDGDGSNEKQKRFWDSIERGNFSG